MTSRAMSRRAFVGAGLSAAAAALAGCAAQGPAQPATSPGGTTKLTFCLDWTPNTNHTGIYVAQHEGYYASEGIELEIVQPSEDTAETVVGSGQAQLGVSFQDYIANVLSNSPDTPLLAVAAILQHDTAGIMSPKELGITSPKGMEHHSFGTSQMPVEQATIRTLVEDDGGDYSLVQMVPVSDEDPTSALKAGMYDSVSVYEGWELQQAQMQGYDVNYFSYISVDNIFDFYTPVIVVNPDFAHGNADVVRAFMRATTRGYQMAVDDPSGAADILCAEVPELDSDLTHASAMYLAGRYVDDAPSWGVFDRDRWARYFQWLNDNDLVENQLDVNAGWTNDYLGD